MKRKEIYKRIVRRFVDSTASEREREVFFHLLREGKLEKYLNQEMDRSAEEWLGADHRKDAGISVPLWRYLAAAIVIGLISMGGLWWWSNTHHPVKRTAIANSYKNDIQPGGTKATLTLGDGSLVTLDSSANGKLVRQGSSQFIKVNAGKVIYRTAIRPNSDIIYNKIATPVGGQYQVTLSDGTRVWLNSLSSIRFPTTFSGGDRTVELTGEGYFEVASNLHKPFYVSVNGLKVAVLGTSFNVNAYPDETAVKATLLQGAIKMIKGNADILLQPGEQGQTGAMGGLSVVKDANVDQALAWKNGFFSFDDANIQTIMRQISRWYGVTVKYEGQPTQDLFWGKMGRDLSLTQLLAGLSKSNVHFQLEGNTLIILP